MELRYTVTDDDVLNALRLSSRPRWALFLLAPLLVIMFAFGIYLVHLDVAWGGWVFVAVSIALGVIVYVVEPGETRRAMQRRASLREEIVRFLNEDGVESTFATGKSHLQWRTYTKYKETAHFFVLHISSNQSTFIPKRVMSPQQTEELRSLLQAQIPTKVTTSQPT